MTICSNGHIATPQDFVSGTIRAEAAFADVKAHGYLAPSARLRFQIGYPRGADPDSHGIVFDPQMAACMTEKQTESVILHEVGHIYHGDNPVGVDAAFCFNFTFAALLVTTPLIRWVRKHALHITAQKRPIMRCSLAALVASQAIATVGANISETQADLFSARSMKATEPLESAVWELDNMQLDISFSDNNKVPTQYPTISSREFWRILETVFLKEGVEGILFDHPSTHQRITTLEQNRAEIISGAKKPLPRFRLIQKAL